MNDRPIGERFSQVYVERGAAGADSARFRRRLFTAFKEARTDQIDFHALLEGELGVHIAYAAYGWDWERYFTTEPLRDVLDTITVVFKKLAAKGYTTKANGWRNAAIKIFREEILDMSSMKRAAFT